MKRGRLPLRPRFTTGSGPLGRIASGAPPDHPIVDPKIIKRGREGEAFGPFEDPRELRESKRLRFPVHDHDQAYTFDARARGDYSTVWSKDVGAFRWGTVQIDVVAVASASDPGIDARPYCEIRILGYYSGIPHVITEQACGDRPGLPEALSPGPMLHRFADGDCPDRIDVQARARRGAGPEVYQYQDETLEVSITTRFHR